MLEALHEEKLARNQSGLQIINMRKANYVYGRNICFEYVLLPVPTFDDDRHDDEGRKRRREMN